MGGRFIVDLEANGFLIDATNIWCIVLKDLDSSTILSYGPEHICTALEIIKNADLLVGHNIAMYDLPLLQRLHDLDWLQIPVVDTILISRLVDPNIDGGHSLESWGSKLGCEKIKFTDFTQYSDEMLIYCQQDVEVSHKLYNHLTKKYIGKYDRAIELEHDFARLISQQILRGFKLDVEFTNNLLTELRNEYDGYYTKLSEILPRKPRTAHFEGVRKSGRLISAGTNEYTYTTEKSDQIKTKKFEWVEGNPRSRQQIIDYFQEKYNWKPSKKTDKGSPIIDEAVLGELPYPEAADWARLFRLNKQIAMIGPESGWLSYVRNGRVHGNIITNGAITGRCTGSNPNMQQIDKRDIRMRECWVASDDMVLVSADAEQLEARVLSHYLTKYDNGRFTNLLLNGDFHTENKLACGFNDRKTSKTFLYGLMYGGGDFKLGKIAKSDEAYSNYRGDLRKLGAEMRSRICDSMKGLNQLQEDILLAIGNRGHLIGIDGRPLFIRSNHAALNTLTQSAGAVIMKCMLVKWIQICSENGYELNKDYWLVGNVHDEILFESAENVAQIITTFFSNACERVGEIFNFKCPLVMNYKIGQNWGEVH